MSSSSHTELRRLAPGYALGILDIEERATFEPHLRECPDCAAEVASLVGVVEALARSAPEQTPPPDLRERVLAAALASAPASVARGVAAIDAHSAMSIIAAADLVRIDLVGQGAAVGTNARVLWSQQHGLALTGAALPPRPPGQQYVLWVSGAAGTRKLGVLREFTGGLCVFNTPRDMAPPLRLLITVEGPGDGQAPRGEPVLVAVVKHPM